MPKTELTSDQLNALIQIINNHNFSGKELEFAVVLKQTLIQMLKERKENS